MVRVSTDLHFKLLPEIVEQPGNVGILNETYYDLGHILLYFLKYYLGWIVWELGRSILEK